MLTPHDKAALLRQIEKLWEFTNAQPTETPCADCAFFSFENDFCRHWKDRIPDEAKATGCDKWQFNPDSVPF